MHSLALNRGVLGPRRSDRGPGAARVTAPEREFLMSNVAEQQTQLTPDGDPVVAYGSYGAARGYGPLRASLSEAVADVQADQIGCSRTTGGYSDRRVAAVDGAGVCWALESQDDWGDGGLGGWIHGPGGHSNGAARYTAEDLAKVQS